MEKMESNQKGLKYNNIQLQCCRKCLCNNNQNQPTKTCKLEVQCATILRLCLRKKQRKTKMDQGWKVLKVGTNPYFRQSKVKGVRPIKNRALITLHGWSSPHRGLHSHFVNVVLQQLPILCTMMQNGKCHMYRRCNLFLELLQKMLL